MIRPLPITLRLALAFTVVSLVVLLAMSLTTVWLARRHFADLDRHQITAKLESAARAAAQVRSAGDLDALAARLAEAMAGHDHMALVVHDGPRLVYASPRAGTPPAAADANNSVEWASADRLFRGVLTALETARPGDAPLAAVVAVDVQPHRAFLLAFGRSVFALAALGLMAMATLGWAVARRGLAPVHALARMAGRIGAERLAERLPLDDVPDELAELAQAFNDMLDRLQDSFARLSNYSADLAHELRTPLTNIALQTQVALSRARSADEYRDTLYSTLEEHERLARMVDDMLYLAKAEHGLAVPQRQVLELADEVRTLLAYYEAVADDKGVQLRLEGRAPVHGDRAMLHRAIGNLLSNAIRHAPHGSWVQVSVAARTDGEVELAVENPGEDIAPEHLPRLFDRFYQVDPARPRGPGGGVGLGLAMARSVAQAHGGTVGVASAGGRTRFTIVLPG